MEILVIFLAITLIAICVGMVYATSSRTKTPLGINTCNNITRAGGSANRSNTTALVLPSSGAIRPIRPKALNGGVRRPLSYLGRGERKSSSCFFITIRLGDLYFPSIRSVFVEALPETLLYCVAVERGTSTVCDYHLHAFVEFKEKFFLREVRSMCFSFCNLENFDCQTVKNRKRLLAYISKEDMCCFYNCKVSDLSFNFQSHFYLSQMEFFDYNHFFVKSNRFCYKYLQHLHSQLHVVRTTSFCYIGPIILPPQTWVSEVFEWYVDFVSTTHYYKKKHLYLYGRTNVGKSFFIRLLLRYLGNLVYVPSYSHYFETLSENHRAIFWDEFDYHRVRVNDALLKLVFAGEPFPITRKYCDDRIFRVTIPCILVSNFKPEFDEALMSRFKIVYACSPLQVSPPIIDPCDTFVGDVEDGISSQEVLPSSPPLQT